jgi:ferritin-like metal-binding protein YciE
MPTTKTKSARTKRASLVSRSKSSNGKQGSSNKKSRADNGSSKASHSSAAASVSGNGNSHSQLEKLMTDSLKDIYWAEKHLTKALPKMKKAATTDELKSAIEEHLAQTEEHVTRLEQVFELMGKKAQGKKCDAMEGLIKEGDSIVEETEKGTMTRDAGIIMAAQKVEHYEIATYGTLVQFAKTLGQDEAAEILIQTLEEEKETDQILSQIAEGNINQEAEQEGEEGEEETEESDESEESEESGEEESSEQEEEEK